MKQLQVLVISDQSDVWENTEHITFQHYFPTGLTLNDKRLSAKWDLAILDESTLGYNTAEHIARILNANTYIPIIYLVDNLETARQEGKRYNYSIGLFHKDVSKSISSGSLDSFIKLMVHQPKTKVDDAVFIYETGSYYQKIPIQDILWIEALKDGCKIITMRRPYQVSVTLQEFEQRFRHPSIVRIHDEYLVNITKVSGFDSDHTVVHQSKLPMAVAFRQSVTQHFNLI